MNPTDSVQIRQSPIYQFDDCYLDSVERKLFKDKRLVDITPKAFDLLLFLVENSGEVISKNRILAEVWGQSFVEESNMAVHISRLRKVIDPDKLKPFIETVSGVGYRFISRVNQIDDVAWCEYQATMNSTTTEHPKDGFDSIAILPLRNENGEEEIDYLADGLTEGLINDLSLIQELRVLARNTVFRFKNKDFDIRETGRKLGVEILLTGRIRVIHDKLLIGVELIKVSDGTQIWGTQLNEDLDDLLETQKHLTRQISDQLITQLDIAKKKQTEQQIAQNTESYKLYLKGKYLFNKKTINNVNNAAQFFHQSISKNPTNVHAYIELANCIRLKYSYYQISYDDAVSQIQPLIEKASQINSSTSDLFVLKSLLKLFFEFDFAGTESNLKMALSLNRNCAIAYYRYSQLLVYTCRVPESLAYLKEYLRLDPISPTSIKNAARIFYFMEQFQNAVIKLQECLELEPDEFESHLLLGINLVELGDLEHAIRAFQKSLTLHYHIETLAMMSYAYAKCGEVAKSLKILERIENEVNTIGRLSPNYLGMIYAALGNSDKAFDLLERAFETRDADIISIRCDPRWKRLRNDIRFSQFLAKVNFN